MTATSGVATRLRRVHSKSTRQQLAATGLREGRCLIYLDSWSPEISVIDLLASINCSRPTTRPSISLHSARTGEKHTWHQAAHIRRLSDSLNARLGILMLRLAGMS